MPLLDYYLLALLVRGAQDEVVLAGAVVRRRVVVHVAFVGVTVLRPVDRDVFDHEGRARRPVRVVLHVHVKVDVALTAGIFVVVVTELAVLAFQVQVVVVVSHPDEGQSEIAGGATSCLDNLVDFIRVEIIGWYLLRALVFFLPPVLVDFGSKLLQEVVLGRLI